MMKQPFIKGWLTALAFLMLILDAKTGLHGASEGVDLCIYTVIPALFPFFVLSAMLTGALRNGKGSGLGVLRRICRIPQGSEILLITGLLGGYPVGAQSVAQAWEKGWLSKTDARRMLGFCNNPGPSFLFGMIAPIFGEIKYAWALWFIQITSSLLTGFLLPGGSTESVTPVEGKPTTLPEALERSVRVTGWVCGWVILFRVVLSFCDCWIFPMLPGQIHVAISGILELTNGCCRLPEITEPRLRFLICSGILSMGGLCVWMQTLSAVKGLGLGWYLPGKAIQTVLSLLLARIVSCALFGESALIPCAIFAGFVAAGVILRKKGVAIREKIVYNNSTNFRRPDYAVPKEY